MVHLATLLLFLSLVAVIYQDFKNREVSIAAFVGVFLPLCYVTYPGNIAYWTFNTCANIVFVALQLLVSFLFISVRRKEVTNIVNTAIGMGDILMLIILALSFSLPAFMLLTLVSFIVSMLQFMVGRILKWQRSTVPLAGVMAMVLVAMLGLKYGGVINGLYDIDSWELPILAGNV